MTPIELQAQQVLVDSLADLDLSEYELGPVQVFKRMLDGADPIPAVGVFLHSWVPTDTPQIGMLEPIRGRYRFGIQTYIKSAEAEAGAWANAGFVKEVRQRLYRDDELRSALGSLRQGDFSPMERALRWGVESTQFTDTSITGGFVYLSQTEFYFETEVA